MYVLQVTVTNSSSSEVQYTVGATGNFPINGNSTEVVIFPADNCVWQIVQNTGGGYSITSPMYSAGHAAAESLIPTISNLSYTVQFGYIGKSGRFVEMSQ